MVGGIPMLAHLIEIVEVIDSINFVNNLKLILRQNL
jgi:hypothetical protein